MSVDILHLTPNDLTLMEALLTTFGEAFNEVDAYTANRPSDSYLRRLLPPTTSPFFTAAARPSHLPGQSRGNTLTSEE